MNGKRARELRRMAKRIDPRASAYSTEADLKRNKSFLFPAAAVVYAGPPIRCTGWRNTYKICKLTFKLYKRKPGK